MSDDFEAVRAALRLGRDAGMGAWELEVALAALRRIEDRADAARVENAALRAALEPMSDWGGPGSGTVTHTCVVCRAEWYGGVDDLVAIAHTPDCLLAAPPNERGRRILEAGRGMAEALAPFAAIRHKGAAEDAAVSALKTWEALAGAGGEGA